MSNVSCLANCTNYLSAIDRRCLIVAGIGAVIVAIAIAILFAPITLSAIAFKATLALASLGTLLLAGSIALAAASIRNKMRMENARSSGVTYRQDMSGEEALRSAERRLNRQKAYLKLTESHKFKVNISDDAFDLCIAINNGAFRRDNGFSATCSDEEFNQLLQDLGVIFAKRDFHKSDLRSMSLSDAFYGFLGSELNNWHKV